MKQAKEISSQELLHQQFHNRDWVELWNKLEARCHWLLSKRYSVKGSKEELITFCKTMVEEVISKIFVDGSRIWGVTSYPNFEDFIVGVIDSHTNNTLKKKKGVFVSIDDDSFLSDLESSEVEISEKLSTGELRSLIYHDLELKGANDDELMIFECLAEGLTKPHEIKKELGMSDVDFNNTWRSFKRKRAIIQKRLDTYGDY